MPKIHSHISARRDTPKCAPQLSIVDPDFHIFFVEEEVESTRVVEMQVADDDFFDVFHFVASGLDRGVEFVLGLVTDAGEDVDELGSPLRWCQWLGEWVWEVGIERLSP
jgi:hypothetical protein